MPLQGTYVKTKALQDHLGGVLADCWRPTRRYGGFSDPEYYLPSEAEIRYLVGLDSVRVDHVVSAAPHFDCEDYAFALRGRFGLHTNRITTLTASICLGLAWGEFDWAGGDHACNWVVTSDRTLWWYEPQNIAGDRFFPVASCRRQTLRLLIV